MNDAQLWGAEVFRLIDEKGIDPAAAEVAARIQLAEIRRERDPSRRTWGPGDALPAPPPMKVADLDGAVWHHQKAGHGCYRMSAKDRAKYQGSSGDYEGVRPWPYLLDSEGPLTEVLR